MLGDALKDMAPRRDAIVVADQGLRPHGFEPERARPVAQAIMAAIDDSLRRLGDGLRRSLPDPSLGPSTRRSRKRIEALHDVVKAGKARYIGASSMHAWQFAKTPLHAREAQRMDADSSRMQNHYNLVYREEEREMLPLCRDQGIGVIPWSPLARGFVTGNRRRQDKARDHRAKSDEFASMMCYNDADFTVVDRVTEIAKKRGVSNAQVALAWMLQVPGITAPIVGASRWLISTMPSPPPN